MPRKSKAIPKSGVDQGDRRGPLPFQVLNHAGMGEDMVSFGYTLVTAAEKRRRVDAQFGASLTNMG